MESGWVGTWSPGLGDNTFVGWFTVVAYFAVAYLCLLAFKRQKSTADVRTGWAAYRDAMSSLWRAFRGFRRPIAEVPARARQAMFWLILAIVYGLLGINKQLDLQSLLTELGRLAAYAMGWYEQRRPVQLALIVIVALVAVGIVYLMARLLRDLVPKLWVALLGLGVTLIFVFIRASSFHDVDVLIHTEVLGLRVNWLLELTGIFIVGRAAIRAEPNPLKMPRIRWTSTKSGRR